MIDNPARKTIEVIAEKNWIKGSLEHSQEMVDDYNGYCDEHDLSRKNFDVGVCLYGAIGYVEKGTSNVSYLVIDAIPWVKSLKKVIHSEYPEIFDEDFEMLYKFNDHENIKVEDIILVLEKTAAKLDEQNG